MSDNPMESPKEGWKPRRAKADPTTWRTTPVCATEAMIEAGEEAGLHHDGFTLRVDLRKAYAAMLQAAPKPPVVSAWQDIETAPKDGTPIILCIAGSEFHPRSAWWSPVFKTWVVRETEGPKGLQATVACSRELSFTHWQPLPEPPATGDADHG